MTTSPGGAATSGAATSGAATAGTPGASAGASTPTGTSPGGPGSTDLRIVVDPGTGARTTWQLTCDPAGGDHPRAAEACGVLASRGEGALAPVKPDQMCTQVFGGDQTATVTGTLRGRPVDARLSRVNGCEIGRWDSLEGLLPAGGA